MKRIKLGWCNGSAGKGTKLCKPGDLNVVPGTQAKVEEENQYHRIVLIATYAP